VRALYLEARRGSAGRVAAQIGAAVDAGAPAAGLYIGAILMSHVSNQHWLISYGTTKEYTSNETGRSEVPATTCSKNDLRRTHTVRLAQDWHVVKASHNPAADVRLMQIVAVQFKEVNTVTRWHGRIDTAACTIL